MSEKTVSGVYREAEDMSLSRRYLIDGIRDAEAAAAEVQLRKNFRGRYGSKLTPPVRKTTRRMTSDLADEPDGKLPL